MIIQDFYIPKYDWYVTVYYNTTCEDTKKILFHLNLLDCEESTIIKIEEKLKVCKPNTGMTYTSYDLKQSIIIISETTGFDEFLNTLTHENMHLSIHIMEYLGQDLTGEPPCYLMGYITQAQANIIKHYICKH